MFSSTFLSTFVTDSVERGLQVRHKVGPPDLAPGAVFHHPGTAVSAFLKEGIARKGKYGQVTIKLPVELSEVIESVACVSPSLRHAAASEPVTKITTNVFPTKLSTPNENSKKCGCDIYVKTTALLPAEEFQLNSAQEHVIFISSVSWWRGSTKVQRYPGSLSRECTGKNWSDEESHSLAILPTRMTRSVDTIYVPEQTKALLWHESAKGRAMLG